MTVGNQTIPGGQLGGIGVSGLSGLGSGFSSLGHSSGIAADGTSGGGDFFSSGSLLQSSRPLPSYGAATGPNALSSFDGSSHTGNDLSFPSSSAASPFTGLSGLTGKRVRGLSRLFPLNTLTPSQCVHIPLYSHTPKR